MKRILVIFTILLSGCGSVITDYEPTPPPPIDTRLRGTFSINNGAAFCYSQNVTITNSILYVNDMCFKDEIQPWTMWNAYSASRGWEFSYTPGIRTIDAIFRNSDNIELPLSDTIEYIDRISTNTVIDSDGFGLHADASDDFSVIAGSALDANSRGAVYIFRRGTSDWFIERKLVSPNAENNTYFGSSVSMSADGLRLLVASPYENAGRGRVYLFERNNGGAYNWGLVKSFSKGGAVANEYFGSDAKISRDGGSIVIGVRGTAVDAKRIGSAVVHKKDQGGVDNWGEVVTIFPDDPGLTNKWLKFGDRVGVKNNGSYIAIADTSYDNAESGHIYSGRVAVYEYSGGTYIKRGAEIGLAVKNSGDLFGQSIGFSDTYDLIAVGASGRGNFGNKTGGVTVFTFNSTDYVQSADIIPVGSANLEEVGYALVFKGDKLTIGAPGRSESGKVNQGSVYYYTHSAGSFTFNKKITAHDGAGGDRFGCEVMVNIANGDLAVGASGDDIGSLSDNRGAIYKMWGELN